MSYLVEVLRVSGFSRVLTSGAKPSAVEGIEILASLNLQSLAVNILPGCGLNSSNIPQFRDTSLNKHGVVYKELHASCRKPVNGNDSKTRCDVDFSLSYKLCDVDEVRKCVQLIKNV